MSEIADAAERARAIAARLTATLMGGGGGGGAAAPVGADSGDALGKRKNRWTEESDSSSQWGWSKGDGDSKKRKIEKKIYIPQDNPDINFMGLLLGPRGSNQKRMEEASGARIFIRGRGSSKDPLPANSPDADDDLHVFITGETEESVGEAAKMVEEILFNPQQAMALKRAQLRNLAEMNGTLRGDEGTGGSGHYGPGGGNPALADGENKVELKVRQENVGLIIGKGGETIRDIQMRSGAHIQVVKETEVNSRDSDRSVYISGAPDAVERAKKLINQVLGDRGRGTSGAKVITVGVPNERVGLIIGKAGTTIKGIQQRTGTNINVPDSADQNNPAQRTVEISGSEEGCAAARAEIEGLLSGGNPAVPAGAIEYMVVPNERVGVVIGKRGETIKGIQARTGCKINVPNFPDANSNPPVRTITIIGGDPNLAKYEIQSLLSGQSFGFGQQPPQQQQQGYYDQYSSYQYPQYGQGGFPQQYPAAGYDQSYNQPSATSQPATQPTPDQQAPGTTDDSAAPGTTNAPAAGDPNDPHAFWFGFDAYAGYYGREAAVQAWGSEPPPEALKAAATPRQV